MKVGCLWARAYGSAAEHGPISLQTLAECGPCREGRKSIDRARHLFR